MVKLRTLLINNIHGILNGLGQKIKKETLTIKKGLRKIFEAKYKLATKIALEIMRDQIERLNNNILKLNEALSVIGASLRGFKNLVSITGIGEKFAAILLTVIGDIDDFEDEGKLASYFRLMPNVRQSNETKQHGCITKVGSKLGRTTLVQCALIAIRYSVRNPYDCLKKHRGSGKAVIATAKKLLGIICQTLKAIGYLKILQILLLHNNVQ
jgi:transposase